MTTPLVFFPRSLDEAVDVLDSYSGTAKVVAGASALSLMLNQRLIAPEALVSLQRVPGLREIERDGDMIRCGALVTHAQAARHPVLRRDDPLLAEAFSVVGNAQVRAAATAGGVVAEADYASDPPAALLALDAHVSVLGPEGRRSIPVGEVLTGFYQTSLSSSEVLTEITVPVTPPGRASAYVKYSSRASEDRPCVGVAVLVDLAEDRSCRDLRIAVGAACDVPIRLRQVEASALGVQLDAATRSGLGEAYAEGVDPVEDVRGSAWYRREMVRVWVPRAVEAACQRWDEARAAPAGTRDSGADGPGAGSGTDSKGANK